MVYIQVFIIFLLQPWPQQSGSRRGRGAACNILLRSDAQLSAHAYGHRTVTAPWPLMPEMHTARSRTSSTARQRSGHVVYVIIYKRPEVNVAGSARAVGDG